MTIDEAIKILAIEGYPISPRGHKAYQEAKKLGIEALKEVKDARLRDCRLSFFLLPGEDK